MSDFIGGFHEFGLSEHLSPHDGGLMLNSGRTALEFILRTHEIKHIYLPNFTCEAVLQPIDRIGVPHSWYSIDKKLELASLPTLGKGEFLLYTNYYGVKDQYCDFLARNFGSNLILDASQSLYYESQSAAHRFYSPRKFFGLPDGGIVYTDASLHTASLVRDQSGSRLAHLAGRLEQGPQSAYPGYRANERLIESLPLRLMSSFTERLFSNVDYIGACNIRDRNFRTLHDALGPRNELDLLSELVCGALCYPFFSRKAGIRQRLLQRQIFVPTFWHSVLDRVDIDSVEAELVENVLPLPIDQRYDESDMRRIIDAVS